MTHQLEVRFFAAARAAAGTGTFSLPLSALPSPTLGALTEHLAATYTGVTPSGQTLADILPRCSFLLDGASATASAPLTGSHRVDVLPPFAGG